MTREEPFHVSHILDGMFRSVPGDQALGARDFFIVAATMLKDSV
jgi:hypothetical protein